MLHGKTVIQRVSNTVCRMIVCYLTYCMLLSVICTLYCLVFYELFYQTFLSFSQEMKTDFPNYFADRFSLKLSGRDFHLTFIILLCEIMKFKITMF